MNSNICEQVCVCACASMRINACTGCIRASVWDARLCVQASDAFMAVSDLSASRFDRTREPGGRERERDGEIMAMEALMSFLGSLCMFLGQGPLAEDVGGLRSREEPTNRRLH